MIIPENRKLYTLANRTRSFARQVREFTRDIPRTIAVIEDCKQLIRSSGSVGANYLEAKEALSKQDFIFRIKVCRKEARESEYWLDLLSESIPNKFHEEYKMLQQEARELVLIFNASIKKAQQTINDH